MLPFETFLRCNVKSVFLLLVTASGLSPSYMNPRITKYEFAYDLYSKGLPLRTESLAVSIAEELSKQMKYENSRLFATL
jgi:hypothetical protein